MGNPLRQSKVSRVIGRASSLRVLLAATFVAGSALVSGPMAPAAAAAGDVIVVGGACTLADAVRAANVASTVGGCANPNGVRVVQVGAGAVAFRDPITDALRFARGIEAPRGAQGPVIGGAPTALPEITADVTIEGTGETGIFSPSGAGLRLAAVAPGASLTLRNLTIGGFAIVGTPSRGCRVGSSDLSCFAGIARETAGDAVGGAIHATGALTLDRVVMYANSATGGASGFAPTDTDNASKAPKDGGSALGGAIFAAGTVTVTDSVFTDNAVVGGDGVAGVGYDFDRAGENSSVHLDGGSGGDALGADIALGDAATADIVDSVFESSRADAGDGAFGETRADVKAGLRRQFGPGVDPDGRNGACTDNRSDASGGDGLDGLQGWAASNGGDGGDAVGSIAGGATVRMDRAAIVFPSATAGAAGQSGIPGLGSRGGNAGDAAQGECSASITYPGDPGDFWTGLPGAAGDAGDNGVGGRYGARGTAVATIDSRNATLTNTTLSNMTAVVPGDRIDPAYPDRRAHRSDARGVNREVDRVVLNSAGQNVATGAAFGASSAMLEVNESSADAGAVRVLSRYRSSMLLNFVTVSRATLDAAPELDTRDKVAYDVPTGVVIGDELKTLASVFFALGSATCPNVNSVGNNWFGGTACEGSSLGDLLGGDERALAERLERTGDLIVRDAFDTPHRMPTRAPNPDAVPALVDAFDAPCRDNERVSVDVDARGGPRGVGRDLRCDIGAHEWHQAIADITIDPTSADVVAQPLPGEQTRITVDLSLQDFPDADRGVNLEIAVSGIVGTVDYNGAGRTGAMRATIPVDPLPQINVRQLFTVDLYPTNTTGDVVVEFWLRPGTSDFRRPLTLLYKRFTGPIVYDPALSVVMDAGSDFGRCDTGGFTYTAGPGGRSIVPELTATVLPLGDTAQPRSGSGTANVVGTGADARWEWAMPELATTSAANVLDLSLRGEDYPNGTVLTPQIAYTDLVAGPVTSSGPGSVTVLPDTTFEVTLVDVATNTEIDRFVTGETTQVGINVRNSGTAACNDVVGVDLSTEVDATAFVAQLIGDLASGASAEPRADFTAPASPGQVEFVTTLDVAGLAEPLVFRRQVPVILGDTTGSSSTSSTSSSTSSTSSSTSSTSSTTSSTTPTSSSSSSSSTSSTTSTSSTSSTSSTTSTTVAPPPGPPTTSGGPVISVPPTIERTTDPGAAYATVEFTVTASAAVASALASSEAVPDALVGSIPVDCAPASGSRFPIGSNTVTCTATDTAGRTSVASFVVNVTDAEPPRIAVPDGPITVVVGSNGPAYVPPSVLDNSGGGSVSCSPGPETSFEVGTTMVTCTATDASGNAETVSFAVVVRPSLVTELPATGGGTAPIRLALMVLTSGLVLLVIATARRRGPGRLDHRP